MKKPIRILIIIPMIILLCACPIIFWLLRNTIGGDGDMDAVPFILSCAATMICLIVGATEIYNGLK